jgi:sulfate adenylyltransferase subunit 1
MAAKPLLRISTAGSVDDGKSTLIGRLLYDTKTVWEDNLEEITKSKVNRASHGIDFSLLTDGLRAEREQGITIDVAYRYFSTPRRQFIVADTPGHEQYTRNMATGASTCDLAIILLDARKGVLEQSRRHARIASLLGVRRLLFTVNKMDLVDFSQEVFDEIRAQAGPLLAEMDHVTSDFLPVSALDGDNVVTRSTRTPWYTGPSLLELLETADAPALPVGRPFRFPVQVVIRPHLDFRGYGGQVVSGRISKGDAVVALPSGKRSRVKRIVTFDGDLDEAFAPMSVTLELEDELDIARGDVLALPASAPKIARRLHTTVVWMNEEPLDSRKGYLLQHGTRVVPARLHGVAALNEIARVEVETAEALPYDTYRDNRATGGFILIDPITNLTLGAGLIESEAATEQIELQRYSDAPLSPAERRKLRALLAHMTRFGLKFDDEDFVEGEGI